MLLLLYFSFCRLFVQFLPKFKNPHDEYVKGRMERRSVTVGERERDRVEKIWTRTCFSYSKKET